MSMAHGRCARVAIGEAGLPAYGDEAGARAALSQGRPDLALTLIGDLDTVAALKLKGAALRAQGLHDAAATALSRALEIEPSNAVIGHNLAAALGDAGRHAAAVKVAKAAIASGGRAPETRLVLGRALAATGDLDAALDAFDEALEARPDYADAHRDRAQLIWMRTGDADKALERLSALRPLNPALAVLAARITGDMLGAQAGHRRLVAEASSDDPLTALAASDLAAGFDPEQALAHALVARRAAPDHPVALIAEATARLGLGQTAEARTLAERALIHTPYDQHALALRQTAIRIETGDDQASRLAVAQDIETPEGWTSRQAFLGDLAVALKQLHGFQAEPFGQSIRGGAQAPVDPRHVGDPVINAAFRAFTPLIDAYVAAMRPDEPMGARRARGWRIIGAWSVLLPAGGRHIDHVHSQGWVSSAFYVETPDAEDAPKASWLRLGKPGILTRPELGASAWIEPKPGRLALFPSYLWHGTEPFTGPGRRLSIAFDVQPTP